MQNTPQTFRGAGAPGVNFSEHSYDNHIGVHCQPTGYQPYPNQPYHPLPSPRPHHYGNHQMQQNMPYRHHGGAYAPNQNQYGSNMNQDMYRNHSGYAGANNRNMSSKPWTENNSSSEMMAPYGQVSHPQIMNNPPPQMPVSTMRSPPHATSNMNPAPPQGQQHFRQMQSPAHSPHSWSQAQIPSPGVMHSSRTTPSPLPTHVRSPGHSQQFSPPAAHAMNMTPHQQPPENGQMPQTINSSSNDTQNPSNPLHSLQKMVMLDQDPKVMLPMMGDGSEQYANHCGPHNYVPEENVNTESKDSAYSTYYNMDENRFESKPSGSNDNSYSNVQQVSNCNFPTAPQMVNSEEGQNNPVLPNSSPNSSECLQSDQSLLTSQVNSIPSVAHSQIHPTTSQNNSPSNLSECPPHAESAPVFTDQTKAAVSTNSEQALESKSDSIVNSNVDKMQTEETSPDTLEKLESSSPEERLSKDTAECPIDSQDLPSNASTFFEPNNSSNNSVNLQEIANPQSSSSDEIHKSSDSPIQDFERVESDHLQSEASSEQENPSVVKVTAEVHKSNEEVKFEENSKSDVIEEDASLDSDRKEMSPAEDLSTNTPEDSNETSIKCDNSESSNSPIQELGRNPVKVVIHRIRKDNTNDTWHVPASDAGDSETCINVIESDKKPDCKIPNVGPQIVILSPVTSEKRFGFRSSVDENSIITIKEEDDDDDEGSVIMERTLSTSRGSGNIKSETNNSAKFNASRSPDKKRGRPMGSKNKIKPGVSVKKKGRRGSRKKKFENSKLKHLDILPKIKKVKVFNGPYVHITGSKENPSSILVVNVAQKEEEKINKISSKRNFSNTANRIKKKPVGHLSTLSPTYDAFNRDKTWLCIFCHKGSHHGGLGDLYGPYYIKDKNVSSTKLPSPPGANSARGKKRKSDHEDRASKKSKQAAGHSADSTPVRNCENDSSDPDSHLRETWIHEDCAVWCQSISLMGEEVQGLEEAVVDAYENTCCQCSLTGATLGCWGKGCKELYHFSCAKETGCQMDIEKFALLCPTHQRKSPDQRDWCQ